MWWTAEFLLCAEAVQAHREVLGGIHRLPIALETLPLLLLDRPMHSLQTTAEVRAPAAAATARSYHPPER